MSISFPSRLGFNKGFMGPDFPGCINSGHAPALLKSKNAAVYLDKPFMVGGSFAIKYSQTECISSAMKGKKTEDMKRFKVRFFKTYSAAKKYFLKLMEDVNMQRVEASRAKEKLDNAEFGTAGYTEALMGAADYGIV